MEEQKRSIFRSETLKRISSPEQLTDYLRVTNPGIWVVLAAVLALLVGFFVWMSVEPALGKRRVDELVARHDRGAVMQDAEKLAML